MLAAIVGPDPAAAAAAEAASFIHSPRGSQVEFFFLFFFSSPPSLQEVSVFTALKGFMSASPPPIWPTDRLAERNVTSPRPGSGVSAAEDVLRFYRNGTAAIIKMNIFLLRICA